MAHLRVYTVHINPSERQPYERAEFVKEGFNVPAFLFTVIYTLYKRLWWQTLAIIAFNLLLAICEKQEWLHAGSLALISLGFQILVGYHANDWVRVRLRQSGYITADLVSGENSLSAEQRFYDRFAATHSLQSP